MKRQGVLDRLYAMRKGDFTVIGDSLVFCTEKYAMIVTIAGIEVEYEYFGDATRAIMSGEHTKPVYGYARKPGSG